MYIRALLVIGILSYVVLASFALDRITLVTVDGSVINVPMNEAYTNITFQVRTSYGDLRFNIMDVKKIVMVTNNVHSIQTAKGESIEGNIISPNLVFPTRYGNLTIPPRDISKLLVIISNVRVF